jgi:hypothetical protein
MITWEVRHRLPKMHVSHCDSLPSRYSLRGRIATDRCHFIGRGLVKLTTLCALPPPVYAWSAQGKMQHYFGSHSPVATLSPRWISDLLNGAIPDIQSFHRRAFQNPTWSGHFRSWSGDVQTTCGPKIYTYTALVLSQELTTLMPFHTKGWLMAWSFLGEPLQDRKV